MYGNEIGHDEPEAYVCCGTNLRGDPHAWAAWMQCFTKKWRQKFTKFWPIIFKHKIILFSFYLCLHGFKYRYIQIVILIKFNSNHLTFKCQHQFLIQSKVAVFEEDGQLWLLPLRRPKQQGEVHLFVFCHWKIKVWLKISRCHHQQPIFETFCSPIIFQFRVASLNPMLIQCSSVVNHS